MGLLESLRAKGKRRLIGKWRLIRAEEPLGEDVSLEFHPDGRLTYSVREGDKKQFMLLTYRASGNTLITDQPSAPREERTAFELEDDRILVLERSGKRSWFRRVV